MTVREAMGSQLITVRDTDSALAGLKILVQEKVSGAPVVSGDSKLVGMVTEFDLLLAIDYVGDAVPISRVMHSEVIYVSPDATLEEARKVILTHRRLPVVDDGKVIGVISRRDLLRVRFGIS